MVFQNYALYPHKTVMENLTMPVESEMSREEARELAESIARKLNIAELLNRYPNELSGGQQQRVALARALMKRPKLFLMDEPLSNLDAIQRISARKLIKDIQRDNSITTVYVTHDQVEAMALADRVGIMDSGRLIQVGTPEEVYNNVANDFVASFFGNPPMSLLSGEFLGIKGRIGIRPEDVVIGEGELESSSVRGGVLGGQIPGLSGDKRLGDEGFPRIEAEGGGTGQVHRQEVLRPLG